MVRFLVTGGLGFIGSNFILHVIENYPDCKITNLDALLIGSDKHNLNHIKNNKNYEFIKGNINEQKLVDKLVSKSDAVFNFAAESHVDRSITNPKPFMDSNIMGVYTILESIKRFKKKLVQISTDEVFGSLKTQSADENYRFNPSSPYAASKASAELLVQSYFTTYDCKVITTRCTNNYGPRQSPEKLIPKAIMLAGKNKKIPIYGKGTNIRDWIFVTDHCKALLKVFFDGKLGHSYNISASNEIDNLTVVKKTLKIMGKSNELIQLVTDRPGHDYRYSLDSSKIRKELHWKPSYNFEKGLEHTVEWYMKNKKNWGKLSGKEFSSSPWKTR